MEQISATRLNLLNLKIQFGVAKDGVRLLRSKREALISEFFFLMEKTAASRDTLEKRLEDAFISVTLAKAFLGEDILESAAYAYKRDIQVSIKMKNIMGVVIPEAEEKNIKRAFDARGASPLFEPYRIKDVAEKFEDILNSIIMVASREIKLKRLGDEIQITTRRINAIEEIIIPSLMKRIEYIDRALEEREREDIFRLKRFKYLKL